MEDGVVPTVQDINFENVCHNVKVLLEDTQTLSALCDKSSEVDEFAGFLYRFFEVHSKTHTLLTWAVQQEVETLTPNEIFRGTTIATRLFYHQFFGDLGKRYLIAILTPILNKILTIDHSLEIEPPRIPVAEKVSVNTERNAKWLIENLRVFVQQLRESVDTCPLGLRESFLFLKKMVSSKVANEDEFIATVIFLRLICPSLVAPDRYAIFGEFNGRNTESKVSPLAQRGLILASKILQSAANGAIWEQHRAHSDIINEFILTANKELVEYAKDLTNEKTIELGRKVMRASISPISEQEIQLACDSIRQFIESYILQKEIAMSSSENQFQSKLQLLMDYYKRNDWKLMSSKKKDFCEYSLSQLKVEGSSLFVLRHWGRYKARFDVVVNYVRNELPEMALDNRIVSFDKLENVNNHCFIYMLTAPLFPLAARDAVLERHLIEQDADTFIALMYSVIRTDKPPQKNTVRAWFDVCANYIHRDPLDPDYVQYNYIYHMDLRGSIPKWVINVCADESMKTHKLVSNKLMQVAGTAPAKTASPRSSPLPLKFLRKSEGCLERKKEKN